MTATTDYYPALTGLRGLAAAWVMLLHLWLLAVAPAVVVAGVDITPVFSCGMLGVDLFFVLSGFLLGQPFLAWIDRRRPFPDLVTFFKRRYLRVLPPFYAQLLILTVGGYLISGAWPIDFKQFLAYLSMEFLLYPDIGPLLNGVWWSLPVEWHFYLLLPLLAWLLFRARAWLVVTLIMVWVIAFRLLAYDRLHTGQPSDLIWWTTMMHLPARLDQFVFGMLAAWAHLRRGPREPAWLPGAALVVGLAALAVLVAELGRRGNVLDAADVPWMFFHWTLIGVPMALIVYGAAAGGRLARALFAGPVLAFLGRISYSLYLWHGIMFVIAYRTGFSQWPPAASLLKLSLWLTPPVIVVSWLSYRLTERPFLRPAPMRRSATADAPSIEATVSGRG